MGPNNILTKTCNAEGTITKHSVVKFGAADDGVVLATAVGDSFVGIALHDAVAGERLEVGVLGVIECKAGGTITRGGFVTAAASGNVAALVAATALKVAVGKAMASAVSGDIFPVLLTHFEASTA
jgi:Uncharacterized conserved protein (DUF2190)